MARSSPEETDCGPVGEVWVKAAIVLGVIALFVDAYFAFIVCLSASEKEIETLDVAGVVRDVDNSRGC
jgi:uncharacterized membrane protein